MSINYPIARNHPTLHAAPTFRPIRRGRRKQGILREYKTEKGKLSVQMFYELDIADQDLMLAIFAIARAQTRGKIVEINDHTNEEKDLISKLELNLTGTEDVPVHDMPCLRITTTKYELLKEVGRSDNDASYKWLKASLRRLGSISFYYEGEKWEGIFHMIGFNNLLGIGKFNIIINPISAYAIYADSMGYINIHREERHSLKNDIEKALHSTLCGLINAGSSRSLYIDKLVKRVYADYDVVVPDIEIRKRRIKIKKAIENISKLDGWEINIFGKGKTLMAKIKRKNIPQ